MQVVPISDIELKELRDYLESNPPDKFHTSEGEPLIIHYTLRNNPLCVRELCEAGCDVNARDKYGNTAIIYAVRSSCMTKEIIHTLLKNGANMAMTNYNNESAIKMLYQLN